MPVRACMCFLIRIYSLLQPPRSLYYNKELMKRTLGRPTYAFEARQYVVSVCVCVRERERERSECVCVCVCERECYRERERDRQTENTREKSGELNTKGLERSGHKGARNITFIVCVCVWVIYSAFIVGVSICPFGTCLCLL